MEKFSDKLVAVIIRMGASAGLLTLAWNAIAWECNLPNFTYWTWGAIVYGLYLATHKVNN